MVGHELGNGTTRVARGNSEELYPQSLQLLVLEASGVSVFPLDVAASLSIGRAEQCEVQLRDPLASRRHATLHTRPLRIEDHGSANGTSVGSSKLDPGASGAVQLGQAISIGSSLLIVRRREDEASPSSGRASSDETGADGSPVVISADMKRLYEMAERVASSPINVLILGETGVGKEVIAETIHRRSARREAGFVRINCAAVSDSLFESELFGHERGAFTGAVTSKPGLIEIADKGTVFLDEVGELGAGAQAKLLRVIEAREVTRVGGLRQRPVDVRFVAATNRDLEQAVSLDRFRADLFFRLNGVALTVPPLRTRTDEIVPLAELFLAKIAERLCLAFKPSLGQSALRLLLAHQWPGNVRELRNAIERAAVLCTGSVIEGHDLALSTPPPTVSSTSLSSLDTGARPKPSDLAMVDASRQRERERIVEALQKCNGNQTRAAALLGMPRRTLVAKLATLNVPRPRKLD